MKSRSIRTLAVLASAGMIVGAFAAGPAEAAKKKKKPPVCAPFAGSEKAGEAELVTVTDAATAEAPVVVEIETGPGVGMGRPGSTFEGVVPTGDLTSESFVNVQVDSAATSAGLYATIEFEPQWDYDLYLDDSEGTEVAHSAGFFNQSSAAGAVGESAIGSENIKGLETSDCGGYSTAVVGATTVGGPVTLKLWLGEAQAAG
jgi:hypothetical protein